MCPWVQYTDICTGEIAKMFVSTFSINFPALLKCVIGKSMYFK